MHALAAVTLILQPFVSHIGPHDASMLFLLEYCGFVHQVEDV